MCQTLSKRGTKMAEEYMTEKQMMSWRKKKCVLIMDVKRVLQVKVL